MKKIIMKNKEKLLFVLPVLFLFMTLACENTFLPPNNSQTPPSGMGSFSLQIAEVNARTILPDTKQSDFTAYRLTFTGTETVTEDRTSTNYGAPVNLPVGTYNLIVTAYLDAEMTKAAAQGSASNITIDEGEMVSQSITLTAFIGTDAGSGTFAWAVTFPSDVNAATMRITPLGANGTKETSVNLLGGNNGNITLNSGYYQVLFTFKMPDVKTLEWLEALHIYQNLESCFERDFGEEYFINNVHTVTFDYNYHAIVLTQSVIHGDTATEPSSDRTGFTFGGWFTDTAGMIQYNIGTPVINNLTLYAKWNPITPFVVPGNTLTDKLNWIAANAASGVEYIVEVEEDEDIAYTTLSYSGNNITINLRGIDYPRTIGLLSNGSMFTVASDVTLVLGDNITLQGRSDNNASSLVRVNSGGTLIMNAGSRITGNTVVSNYGYGGGVYVDSGTFTMEGGEISGNNTTSRYGGGVYVNSGTFTMNNGEISGNTVVSNYGYGGGVYVNSGTFTMNNGEISGNTAVYGGGVYVNSTFTMNDGEISGNTAAAYGGGVYIDSGIFTMNNGEISNNTGNSRGGGVYIDSGIFTMNNGEISGNNEIGVYLYGGNNTTFFTMEGGKISGNDGNGVYLYNSNIFSNIFFTMEGGEISGNTGSGVHVGGNGTFTMNGGEISGNTDSSYSYGDGVSVAGNGTFTMEGGKISGNDGNGVYVYYGTFTMEGGEISGNGGGVYVYYGTFTMEGGEISGNSGGGVYIASGIFTMNNGEISNNTGNSGGGVYIASGVFTMNNGKISDNTASYYGGGGVYFSYGTFTMNGGEISDNTASYFGGGVCVEGGTFTMSGGIIYGSNAAVGLRNIADYSGAALYKSSSSSVTTYGIVSDGVFTKTGDLATTDDTIQVVNGVLVTS